MSYNDQIIERVVETYCHETGNQEFLKDDVINWAIDNKHWKPSRKSQVAIFRAELSAALRAEKKKVRGRDIRQYHCIRRKLSDGYIQTVWAHIDVATEPFMEQSIAHQRNGVKGIVFSIHNTVLYWKSIHPESQLEFLADFRNDNADRDYAIASGQIIEDDDAELEGIEVPETV